MNITFRALLFMCVATMLPAAPSNSQKSEAQAKRSAIELFKTGQSAAAVAHLRNNIAPDAGSDGAATALTQSLIEVSHYFYNQRRLDLAKEASIQAASAGASVVNGRSSASESRRAALLSSLGVLSEEVERDYRKAESLYSSAAALEPANPMHSARKQAVAEKQRARG